MLSLPGCRCSPFCCQHNRQLCGSALCRSALQAAWYDGWYQRTPVRHTVLSLVETCTGIRDLVFELRFAWCEADVMRMTCMHLVHLWCAMFEGYSTTRCRRVAFVEKTLPCCRHTEELCGCHQCGAQCACHCIVAACVKQVLMPLWYPDGSCITALCMNTASLTLDRIPGLGETLESAASEYLVRHCMHVSQMVHPCWRCANAGVPVLVRL